MTVLVLALVAASFTLAGAVGGMLYEHCRRNGHADTQEALARTLMELRRTSRELTVAQLRVASLRGQVRILSAGMVTDIDREWAQWDR